MSELYEKYRKLVTPEGKLTLKENVGYSIMANKCQSIAVEEQISLLDKIRVQIHLHPTNDMEKLLYERIQELEKMVTC